MPELETLIQYGPFAVLFLAGILAGFINVMAGGGSTLTLPMLIFLGLDGATANGTNRVAIAVQNLAAVRGFHSSGFSEFKQSAKFALFTLPGAVAGALLAVRLDDGLFRKILGVVLVGIVVSFFFSTKKKEDSESQGETPRWKTILGYAAMFATGFYGGFIQVGVGFILMAVLFHLLGMNLVRVNMHKVFVVFVYTVPALAIFIWAGNVSWSHGLTLAAGNTLGGLLGARMAVRGGEKIIRLALGAAILIMSTKLIGLW